MVKQLDARDNCLFSFDYLSLIFYPLMNAEMPDMASFDIVIFGATGFTGQFVVEEFAQVLAQKGAPKLTWAVAGRNEGKLRKVSNNSANSCRLS